MIATFLGLLLAAPPALAADDVPLPKSVLAESVKLPEGFRATLFAAEPTITQPLALTTDDRGRVWVVECNSYPDWSTERPGQDRVLILEDTNHDGTFDKHTVFLDNGQNLTAIEVGHGGVWLASLPNVLFIPVNPGEDKPAGPPQIVLDGWSLNCKHTVINGFIWGPDGWLWGSNGYATTQHIGKPGTPEAERVAIRRCVWRLHPKTHTFEQVTSGTTNPFGLDFDDLGQAFITNCVIDHLWHATWGAHFRRMYGEDLATDTFADMDSIVDHRHWAGGHWTDSRGGKSEHTDAGGGHAHAGGVVYLGDNFPPEYRNSVFMANVHGRRLNRDTLTRRGASYTASHAPDFAFFADPWFRPSTVKPTPDGGLFVCDFSDTGECHDYEHIDRTTGRIYKIVFGTPTPFTGDLSALPDAELVRLQLHPNDWHVRHARRVLAERAIAGTLAPATVPALRELLAHPDVTRQLRAVWALHNINALTADDHIALLNNPREEVRAWGVRLAAEARPGEAILARFEELGRHESSLFVRLHLAGAVSRFPSALKLRLTPALLSRAADNAERNLAILEWNAVNPAGRTHPEAFLAAALASENRLARQFAARQAVSLPAPEPTAHLERVVAHLPVLNPLAREDVLVGIRDALADRVSVPAPANWTRVAESLATDSPTILALTRDLALKFGDPAAVATALAQAADATAPAADRVSAIERLAARKTTELAEQLRSLLSDPAVRAAAIRALAADADPATATAILEAYPRLSFSEKQDAIQTLTVRGAFARLLLDATAAGTVPKADLTAFSARQILALNDPALTTQLKTVWGEIRPGSETRAAQAEKFRTQLTPETLKSADIANGRRLYVANCASCHKLFGEGGDVGPELTGSQRTNLDYILENILDPNAIVPFDYKMVAFELADGRIITGLVRSETENAVTVRTANDTLVIPKADIDARKPTNNSVMPEGLLDALADAEVRDLVAYLASPAQVPLADSRSTPAREPGGGQ